MELCKMSEASTQQIENLLEDLNKSLSSPSPSPRQDDTSEILARGTDAIISQNEEMVETLCKGLNEILDRLEIIEDRLEGVPDLEENINKGFSDILDIPQAPRAIQREAEQNLFDFEGKVETLSKAVVLNKALDELQTASTTRRNELQKAIAQLDSNYSPEQVANTFGLKG
ncbi:MAG TPA: hypothetical protein DF712_02865 [Balneola sp.]|nr:hypothetical protein [Balneola sp.]